MKGYAYIGCRTTKERNARGKGISIYESSGDDWKLKTILEDEVNPSYLCLNHAQDRLYAVHGDYSEVSAYRIEDDGTISHMNTVSTHGTNPVHLTLTHNGKWLIVANLQTGGVAVIPVIEDGSLAAVKELYFISGNGGPGYISHPHQVMLDKTGRWLLVPSQGRLQGIGKVTIFEVDQEEGVLKENCVIKARTGAEPRHIVLHPSNRYAYLVNEKDSTVTAYAFDADKGCLTSMQILSTLPEDCFSDGWASAIDMGNDGSALYLSNRKHDSVTVYSIDQDNGKLSWLQNIKTGGEQPRFISVSPDGGELWAANELTDTINLFDIDKESGCLIDVGRKINTESPVCVAFKMI